MNEDGRTRLDDTRPIFSTQVIRHADASLRVVRIPRDYTRYGDRIPFFNESYPPALCNVISQASFRAFIERVNAFLHVAFRPSSLWNIADNMLALVTGWISELLYENHTQRVVLYIYEILL